MSTTPVRASATSLTALALALSLAACGSSEAEPEASTEPNSQVASAEPATPASAPSSAEVAASDTEAAPDQDVEAALDQYVALEQAQLDATGDALAEVYSEVSVIAEYPNTIVYAYTYAEQMDPTATADQLASMSDTLKELCESAVFPAMEATGVTPTQKATYVYYNADGSELWTKTFES